MFLQRCKICEATNPLGKKGEKMTNKEQKTMSVVTLPLKTEPWQADRLTKMLENCRAIYNTVLGQKWKEYQIMTKEQEYIDAMDIVKACYQDKDDKKKKSPECKAALETLNHLRRQYDISEYGFGHATTHHRLHYSNSISSNIANLSIAKPAWRAFDAVIFGKGEKVRFKRRGEMTSMASDGKSGFRLVTAENETLDHTTRWEPMFLAVGGRGVKPMRIPVVIPKNDRYKSEMTDNRKVRVIRVVKKTVRGKDKYYIQMTVDGAPAAKLDKNGNERHTRGTGKVGIYIDTRTVTAVTEDGEIRTYKLNEGIDHFEEEKALLQAYMSHSRLVNNPDNFNEDGTIKNGRVVDGIRRPLVWNNSARYFEAKGKLADLFRVERETRRLERIKLANEIMSLGNDIYINAFPFAEAAKRKTEDNMKSDGTPASKAKAGKAIGENAPGVLTTLLKNRVEADGSGRINVIKISGVEKTDGYRERYAAMFLKNGEAMMAEQENRKSAKNAG